PHLEYCFCCRVYADCWRRWEHRQCLPVHRGPTGHPAPLDGARYESAALRLLRGLSAFGRPGWSAFPSPGPGKFLSRQRTPASAGNGVWLDTTSVARHLVSVLNAMKDLQEKRKELTMSPITLTDFVEATAKQVNIPGVAVGVGAAGNEIYACHGVTS